MANDKPQVLFVTKSDLSGRAGNNIATREAAVAFARNESVETTFVCPEPRNEYPPHVANELDNPYYLRSKSANRSIPERASGVIDAFRTVQRAIDETDPDLIVARMAPIFLAPPLLVKRNDVPYVLLSRGTAYKTLRFDRILSQIYKLNVRIATDVYVASEEIRQDTERMSRTDRKKAHLLPNAVDPDTFEPVSKEQARSEVKLDADLGFTVGFVGSMKEYHRIDALLEAAAIVDSAIDVSLVLVGDGPELDRYRQVAEEKGLDDNVHFPGFVDHSEVNTYLSACDVLYGVSNQDSATPVKIFEYLACERPVIVRNIGDLAFVSDLELGRMVTGTEAEGIANAIEELHNIDESKRKEMGELGREYVVKERTWNAFVTKILEDQLPTGQR